MTSVVDVSLTSHAEQLWRKFEGHQMEMLCSPTGRSFFPPFKYSVKGLDPVKHYVMMLKLELASNYHYSYSSSRGWHPVNQASVDPKITQVVIQRDSPRTGEKWMESEIDFSYLKVKNKCGIQCQVMLYAKTAHKYIPSLQIFEVSTETTPTTMQLIKSFKLSYTSFISTPRYRNPTISALKMRYNRAAKGILKRYNPDLYYKDRLPRNENPDSLDCTESSSNSSASISLPSSELEIPEVAVSVNVIPGPPIPHSMLSIFLEPTDSTLPEYLT